MRYNPQSCTNRVFRGQAIYWCHSNLLHAEAFWHGNEYVGILTKIGYR